MDYFEKYELDILNYYCDKSLISRAKVIEKRVKDKTIKIVNTGMVSSGKSSLYNALLGYNDIEKFPTGAARTTVNSSYCKHNNIIYIDTPGIDVREEDDYLALNTIMEADIIMMIHNIKTGPLHRSEVRWLKNIVNRLGSREACKARLIFICSWIDTRDREDGYQDIIADVKEQVVSIVGCNLPFFEVSVKKYNIGVSKGKEGLIRKSGLIDLKEYIDKYAVEYLKQKTMFDIQELKEVMKEIKKTMLLVKVDKQAKITSIIKKNEEQKNKIKSRWDLVFDFFYAKRQKYDSLKRELVKIKEEAD